MLEITKEKAIQMSELEDKANQMLHDFFDGKCEIEKAVLARAVANTVAKNRVAHNELQRTNFGMVASFTKDEKALKKYVISTQPMIKKALTGK